MAALEYDGLGALEVDVQGHGAATVVVGTLILPLAPQTEALEAAHGRGTRKEETESTNNNNNTQTLCCIHSVIRATQQR